MNDLMFPAWARIGEKERRPSDPAFFAGASLALLDRVVAAKENPCAGALRQRLALRAATACAKMARLREDEAALRDAEHLASSEAHTSPAGRLHRLWRLFATGSMRFDAPTLRRAADLIDLPQEVGFEGLADGLRDIVSSADHPLAAAAGASALAMTAFEAAPRIDAEIFALWLADLALANKLSWDAPIPLLAAAIGHPSLRRGANGKRPRAGETDWTDAMTVAYALAAAEAFALAGELSRRARMLLGVAPKLRAKRAGQVVELLLSDDVVAPARAAKTARLSDRAARRLFDRLIALGAGANSPVARIFGFTGYRVFEESATRFA